MAQQHPATVLVLAGNDPTGGAGLQADIETIASLGCRAAPVVTAVTVQDTHNVIAVEPTPSKCVTEQAQAILADLPIAAIKVGLIATVETLEAIVRLLDEHPHLPLVVDPILAAGGGRSLTNEALQRALAEQLLPRTTVLTPNSVEARLLATYGTAVDTPPLNGIDASAAALQGLGGEWLLISGGHEEGEQVCNRLYHDGRLVEQHCWPRLPHTYHGSGCTLAAAIAASLAAGLDPVAATFQAQQFTWQSLKHGYSAGGGQWLPDRLHWSRRGDQP